MKEGRDKMDVTELLLAGEMPVAVGADGCIDVPMFPIGNWHTGKYADLPLGRDRALRTIDNFKNNVLGRRVRVDTDHDRKGAQGWLKDMFLGEFTDARGARRQGPIAKIEPTPKGLETIANKEYAYFSIDMAPHKIPETGEVVQDVVKAFSFTNDPVLPVPAVGEGDVTRIAASEAIVVRLSELQDGSEVVQLSDAERERIDMAVERYLEERGVQAAETASVDGEDHPASDFAYVPDPAKPSTWKFPIYDKAHVANAAARWGQADIPAADRPKVLAKIVAAHKKFMPDTPMPDSMKLSEGASQMDEVKLTEENTRLSEENASLKKQIAAKARVTLSERIKGLHVDKPSMDAISGLVLAEGDSATIVLSEGAVTVELADVNAVNSAWLGIVEHMKQIHTKPEHEEMNPERSKGAKLSETDTDFISSIAGSPEQAEELRKIAESKIGKTNDHAFHSTPDEAFEE